MTWQDAAACNGLDTELFYDTHIKAQATAKSVCAMCPVVDDCHAAWAVMDRYARDHGIWFGTTPHERERRRLGRVCDDCKRVIPYVARVFTCGPCRENRRRRQSAAYEQDKRVRT